MNLEIGLHQLAPYIGKMKPSTARNLMLSYTKSGSTVLDPFVGSGTVALEAYIHGRNIICADTNPYAAVLTQAKIHPPRNLSTALSRLEPQAPDTVAAKESRVQMPKWVRNFFHPRTFPEIRSLSHEYLRRNDNFSLACLLGILHHQRPGFLSYPSNHLVPYLLTRKYPRKAFRTMYQYREVLPRLVSKVCRAYRNFPEISYEGNRSFYLSDGLKLSVDKGSIDAVITSPPYMDNLDYYRDNRLRLWFLGVDIEGQQKHLGAPHDFREFLARFFRFVHHGLVEGGLCILVLGNVRRGNRQYYCARIAKSVATSDLGLFRLHEEISDPIPENRRSRHYRRGTTRETVLILEKK